MTSWIYLLALMAPLGATLILVRSVRTVCFEHGILDFPGGRKQHPAPVPRLGGVALFSSFTGTVLAGFILAPSLASLPSLRELFPQVMVALAEAWQVKTQVLGLLAGGTIMFAVGLADDLLGDRFSTRWKFAGQSVAAAVAVACGIHVEFLGIEPLNMAVSFFWILGISNAFNLLDNMDGLATGVAAVCSVIFLVNAAGLGAIFICLVLTAFIGSLLGFLRFNFYPASVFMGDCGALFIGFTLSSLTILADYVSPASSSLFPVLMPPLVLAMPLLDTMSVIYIRIREGRPIYVGDRCHLSHRLVLCGLSEPQAVIFLFLVTLVLGLGALHLADASPLRSLWIVLDSVLMAALVLWGIRFGVNLRNAQPHVKTQAGGPNHPAEEL